MNSLQIKKGDNVLVIAGKENGKTGQVIAVNPKANSVIVKGINMISKHTKPRSAQEKGGIVKIEGKMDASNVQIICPKCSKATRIAHSIVEDKKIRICKKCGASLEIATKAITKTKSIATAKKATAKKVTATKAPVKTNAKSAAQKTLAKKSVVTKKSTTTVRKSVGNK